MKRGLFRVLTLALFLGFWTDASAEILVTTNSPWRFRKGASEASSPTNAWRALAFDDSTWSLGNAPFYYDADPAPVYTGNTLLGDMQNGYTCVFMRRKFVIANAAEIATLTLRFWCDDGFVAWINGTLVTNYNQTSGNYACTNVASIGAAEPLQWFGYTLTVPQSYLVNGTNVIAVQAFNRPITSSDFVIDLELTSALNDSNPPTIASVNPPPGVVSTLSQITVMFSEPVAGVSFSDLLLNGIPATGVNGVGTTYTFAVDQPPYGGVQMSWDAGASITDFGSPPNPFNPTGPGATWQYNLVDAIPPVVAALNPLAGVTVQSLSQIEVTFSEPVTGVNASDLLINGSPASSVVGSLAGPYVFQFASVPAGAIQVGWASGHNIRDTAATPNNFAGGNWSYTVDPNFNTPPVRINEFLTSYSGTVGLADEDGELQDWIELYNSGTSTVSLQGWSLTDEPDEPGRWAFPGVTLGPGQYLVVCASGKDRKPTTPGARLHTNFKLNSAADYLGLFNAESPRVVMSEFAPEFPEQRSDYSYGFDGANNFRYFQAPTPGSGNGNSSIVGVVPPVHFNVPRGLFDLPFTLVLNTALEGATIRYTTDGSEPTDTTGQVYTGPLTISQTTTFRAAAFKANYLPSTVGTQTYIFLNQVIAQPNDPPGFPPVWIDTQNRTWTADYEMDPEITTDPQYSGLMRDSLRALPVISLVTKPEDMFDNTTGIYPKSQARGPSWERPASVEFIFHNEGDAVQIDCGVQMQGNSVRDPIKTGKHAFRFVFKGDYGPAKLRYRVFPDSPVEEFDTLTVRADFNNSWMHWNDLQRPRGQRVRDAFIKDSQRAMSGLSAHNRFFHLYVNGLYWGVYDPVERPDAGFAVEYLGGEKTDYDVVNEGALVDGNMTAYNFMIGLTNLASNAQYDVMKQYLDVTHHIDYMLLHFYIGHEDWGLNKNWYTLRRRAPGQGFKYIAWDGELTLNSPTQNRVTSTDTASGLHTKLVANAEYRLDFADRVHKHVFNGGALAPGVVAARYQKRIDEVDLAMIAESARWGDYRRDVHQYQTPPYELYTRNIHFLNEKNRLLSQYFPGRTTTVLNQLRTAGLYPATAAPVFSQHGGRVPLGFNITMSAPAGTIYYTTNGTDPRVIYTGAISASARTYSGPIPLNSTVVIKSRVLNGSEWSALNEALFQVEELGVPLRITEIMYNPVGGDPYEFIEIQNVGATTLDVSGFSLEGVSFFFPPNSVLTSSQIIVLASSLSPSSFATQYPGVGVLGYFDDGLNNGGERIAILDRTLQTITSVNYDDGNGWPAAADGSGPSLEIIDPRGDPDDPANWRASAGNNGSPGSLTAPSALGPVRLNEIMADNLGAVTNGAAFPDWIELQNAGGSPVSLSGWSLSDDGNPRKFVFPATASIAAGGYLIVWCDSDFAAPGLHTGFGLGRSGESVFLCDPGTNRMDAVSFGLQIPNLTVGRVGPGAGAWQLCQPTPGAANVAQSLASASNLVINEWLAKPAPGADDWIELHNRHATLPASLQGLYLTSTNSTFRIQSLSFIAAAGFAQLIADENAGADHVDFKIAAEGGTIALHDTAGAEIDRINYGLQTEGVSEGRLPDGSATIVSFPASASPDASNYLITYTGPTLNEVMAWNSGAVTNSAGRAADWIELSNPGGASFSMAGMSLSDEPGKPGQWIFPAGVNVPANGYRVIWFDGERPASTNLQANLNTGWSLDRRSGGVWLYNSAGQTVDFVEYGFQVENLPIGKNGGPWELLDSPTPGTANANAAPLGSVAALRINEWMANPVSGDDWFELHNASDQPLSIAGLYVSDDLTIAGQTNSSIAPISFIGPRGFVKFAADGSPGRGRDHTGFQLDSLGEAIVLLDTNLGVIDGVYFGVQTSGVSAGRLPDGGDTIFSFGTTPSPDASNYLPLPNAVINELLSHTDLPLEDAVELHNPTASPADISGWFLSDDPANFKKFQIPGGTTLSAFGYKVFYENQLDGGAGSLVPFTFDSVRGDEVWLSAADGLGGLTGFRSVARFGASANGVSFGRYATSVGEDFVAMTQHTFGVSNPVSVTQFRTGAGAANAGPQVGPVVVTEIMYHPVSGSGLAAFEPKEEEFIELQNITGGAVSLYDPAHLTNTWRLGGGIEFVFPGGVTLPAQSHLLVVNFDPATNSAALAAFRTKYAVSNSVPIVGPFDGRLDNSGESIELLRPDTPQAPGAPDAGFVPQILVERIVYSPVLPWPTGTDGSGASLQRITATAYGNDPVNWNAEAPTAGRDNSTAIPGNQAPVLAALVNNRVANEGTALSFTASATDPNPGDTLTFTLENAPSGATINSASGAFTWTPTEPQGPGTNVMTVRVTDNGSPNLTDAKSFTVVVNEVNVAPVLAAITDRNLNEGLPLGVTATATDVDLPSNLLTYSLDASPAGVSIHPASGALNWTPGEAQGPGVYDLTLRVTDNGSPALFATRTFRVTVNEENSPPALSPISNRIITAGDTLNLTLAAADNDIPLNALSFSFVSAPADASLNSATGQLSWTPALDQAGTNRVFTVRVTDNGLPNLNDTRSFTVTVTADPVVIVEVTAVTANSVALSWGAVAGKTYRVQFKNDLSEANWNDVPGDVTASGSTASKVDTTLGGSAQRFYRIVLLN